LILCVSVMFRRRQKANQALEEHLRRYGALIKDLSAIEERVLRFKSKLVAVSEIAAQYYCEKKVELRRIHGEEETPEIKEGKVAHDLLLKDTVQASREEILRKVFSGEPVMVREMPLLGKHNNVIIDGMADAVLLLGGDPVLLLEHKSSKRSIPFSGHHVQAGLYCHLLNLMGWDTSRTKYALVMAPPECREDGALREIPQYILKHRGERKLMLKLQSGCANIYIYDFDPKKTVDDLNWALDFWKGQRSAVPTKKHGKCMVCQFNKLCTASPVKQN